MAGCSSGIDIVSIERMKRASQRGLFMKRVFTAGEIEYAMGRKRPEKHLAGRFAAKEAAMKALSKGVLSGISLRDIEVVNGEGGKPFIRLAGAAKGSAPGEKIHLSIAYTKEFAFALVAIG